MSECRGRELGGHGAWIFVWVLRGCGDGREGNRMK